MNTGYQVGSALGLAAMTALASSQGADEVGNAVALTDGYSAAFLGAAGVAVAGGLLALLTLRGSSDGQAAATSADESEEPLVAA